MNDIVYEEQKQLIKMWKDKYYEKKEEIEKLQKDLTYYQEYSADLLNKNNTFESIIKEVREYIEFLKEHYEELRTSPVEDSYFINDMLRQMFIQSIENYLLGIEEILDKENI